MKTTKKMMVAALLALAVLSVGITPIFAAPTEMSRGVTSAQKGRQNSFTAVNSQAVSVREQVKQRLQAMYAEINIDELDEADIDKKFAEVEEAAPTEDTQGSVVWYLNARGMSVPTDPVVEEENPQEPLGLQLIAEKVKVTDFGVLYKVLWGRVHHTGEKVDIAGYAILDSDGIFYMKLNGEDLSYKAIGKIAPAGVGVKAVNRVDSLICAVGVAEGAVAVVGGEEPGVGPVSVIVKQIIAGAGAVRVVVNSLIRILTVDSGPPGVLLEGHARGVIEGPYAPVAVRVSAVHIAVAVIVKAVPAGGLRGFAPDCVRACCHPYLDACAVRVKAVCVEVQVIVPVVIAGVVGGCGAVDVGPCVVGEGRVILVPVCGGP